MTRVIALAFKLLHESDIIPRSFKCTGINLHPDSSEDHELSVKGFKSTDLDIANWQEIPISVLESRLKVKEEDEEDEEENISKLKIQYNGENTIKFSRALLRQKLDFIKIYAQKLGITTLTGTKQLLAERILEVLSTAPGSQGNPIIAEAPELFYQGLIPSLIILKE
jgi:hypothetical protein